MWEADRDMREAGSQTCKEQEEEERQEEVRDTRRAEDMWGKRERGGREEEPYWRAPLAGTHVA